MISQNKKDKTIFYLIILGVLFLWAGFILVSFFYYYNNKKNNENFYKKKDFDLIQFIETKEEKKLNVVFSDLKLLENLPVVKEFLLKNNTENKKRVEELFYQFSLRRAIYDQVRFLDNSGQEIIRVNYSNGKSFVVDNKDLQNKKGRYYFDEAIKLSKESIYISPLDLNIEQNKIEEPYKPMIRIATPVFSGEEKKGIIIFNYLAEDIINDLDINILKKENEDNDVVEMLNKDGYWLNSREEKNEWGFMFESKKDLKMAIHNPILWAEMNQKDSGQLFMEDGLYTFSTLVPVLNQNEEWKIYHFTPNSLIYKESDDIKSLLFVINIIFTNILIFVVVGGIIFFKRLNKEIYLTKKSEEKFKAFSASVKDSVIIVDNNGEVILWNKTSEKMFGYKEEEVLHKNITDFILIEENNAVNSNIFKLGYIDQENILEKNTELNVKNKKGEELVVELSISNISINDYSHTIFIARDVTQRKKDEDMFKDSKKEIEKALKDSERINQLMVGRELEMIKLKKELLDLKNKIV